MNLEFRISVVDVRDAWFNIDVIKRTLKKVLFCRSFLFLSLFTRSGFAWHGRPRNNDREVLSFARGFRAVSTSTAASRRRRAVYHPQDVLRSPESILPPRRYVNWVARFQMEMNNVIDCFSGPRCSYRRKERIGNLSTEKSIKNHSIMELTS